MKNIKNLFLAVLTAFFVLGCNSTKSLTKKDNTTTEKVTKSQTVTRPGDTVTISIPNIKYRDTTITRINYDTKTMVVSKFDKDGNQTIDCISAELTERLDTIEEKINNDISENSEKENSFNPQYFIYSIAALVLVVVIALIVVVYSINKAQSKLPEIINQFVNSKK